MKKGGGVRVIDLIKLFPIISLFFTHPLEQLSITDWDVQKTTMLFFNEFNYISPDDGFIKNIIENEEGIQVILSLESGNEVVYSGLTGVNKNIGDRIFINENIGIDSTISSKTKFALVFYKNSELFPQFKNNSLKFLIEQSNKVYMIADGSIVTQSFVNSNLGADGFYTQTEGKAVVPQSFISWEAGLFSQVKLAEKKTYISYWHLSLLLSESDTFLRQGDLIALSGNTGYSLSPRLVLHIEDEEFGDDIRVIYFRQK